MSFAREVDVAGIPWSAAKLVVATGAGGVALALLAGAVAHSGFLSIGLIVLLPLLVRTAVRARADRERRRFSEQLPDHLAVVASAMRAGHGLPGALAAVLDEAPQPSRREFERVSADERLGAPLEDALHRVAERMGSRDLDQVGLLAVLQREAGANTAEMLERVVATIRERQELRRAVRTLTAQGRLSRWILTVLPGAVLLMLSVLDPGYADPLFHSGTGHILLALGVAMIAAGSLVIKRIVEFEI
jgi:tight adherence protein B